MKKIVLFICCALAVGLWLQSRPRVRPEPPVIDGTNRVANCVVRLNGQDTTTHSFGMGERIEITGEMQIVHPTDDLQPRYVAFLVALDHPKAKNIVADSGGLPATIRSDFSKFSGHLKAPQRAGSYELRLFFIDSHQELQAMDPVRMFYRAPVIVRS